MLTRREPGFALPAVAVRAQQNELKVAVIEGQPLRELQG